MNDDERVSRDAELATVYGLDVVKPGAPAGQVAAGARGFSMAAISDAISIVDGSDPKRREKVEPWVRRLSWLLDEMFKIPVINRRVGLDGVLGLIPGIGEGAGVAASFSVVVSALAGGASIATVLRMVLNIGVDALFGSIPIAGQAWDFYFKSNTRNLKLLNADLLDREATRRSSLRVLLMALGVAIVLVGIVIGVVFLNIILFVWAAKTVFGR